MSEIKLCDISHSYNLTPVLKDVNLTIKSGEFFTLLGPSGCGKTTLLRIIAGFITDSKGKIMIDGKDISSLPCEKRNIGFVFQNYALFSHMTVFENVAFGLKTKKLNKKAVEEKTDYYLKLVSMSAYKNRKISELSGGQQQRVALARALAIEPAILLLDEPMSNLDVSLREEMRLELKALQERLKITTVFVTHDQNEALSISDKVAIINDGVCLQCDTPEKIYNFPKNAFIASFLGKTNAVEKSYFNALNIHSDSRFIYIRPEMLLIKNSEEAFTVKVKITKKQFLGNITRYICSDEKTTFTVDELSDISNLKSEGESAFLAVKSGILQNGNAI